MRVAILDDIHNACRAATACGACASGPRSRSSPSPRRPATLRGCSTRWSANRRRARFTRELLGQLPDPADHRATRRPRLPHSTLPRRPSAASLWASRVEFLGAAELAIGLAMAVMRQIPSADTAMKHGMAASGSRGCCTAKALGLVGLGRIGRHVAELANTFGMRVLAWGPRLTDDSAGVAGTERRELDDLLRESDVVSMRLSVCTRDARPHRRAAPARAGGAARA